MLTDSQPARPSIVGLPKVTDPYPIYLEGTVVKGFGRGSRELGIPTANLPEEVATGVQTRKLECGVYYGWAQVQPVSQPSSAADGLLSQASSAPAVYPMVMSIGWNPFYRNQKKSAEVHIIHEFPCDFYGDLLRVVNLGFIRPEQDYNSIDALIEDIQMDIRVALNSLDRPDYARFKSDPVFSATKTRHHLD